MRAWFALGFLLLGCGSEGAPNTPADEQPAAGTGGVAGTGGTSLGGTGGTDTEPTAGATDVGEAGIGGTSGSGGSIASPGGAGGRASVGGAGSSSGGPSVAGTGGTAGMGGHAGTTGGAGSSGGKAGGGGMGGTAGMAMGGTGGEEPTTRSLLGCGESSSGYVCTPETYLWKCPDKLEPVGTYGIPGPSTKKLTCAHQSAQAADEWCCNLGAIEDTRLEPASSCPPPERPYQFSTDTDGDYSCLGPI